jgi:hypothetical protein
MANVAKDSRWNLRDSYKFVAVVGIPAQTHQARTDSLCTFYSIRVEFDRCLCCWYASGALDWSKQPTTGTWVLMDYFSLSTDT